jgi:hypothetical protein
MWFNFSEQIDCQFAPGLPGELRSGIQLVRCDVLTILSALRERYSSEPLLFVSLVVLVPKRPWA